MLPGRTDNDVKNRWHSCVRSRNKENINPMAQKAFSSKKVKKRLPHRKRSSPTLPEIKADMNNSEPSNHKELAERETFNVISFDDETYDSMQEAATFRCLETYTQNIRLKNFQRGEKRRISQTTPSLPKICSDIKTLGKDYCYLLSPIRKDDKTSLAKEIYDLRLRTNKKRQVVTDDTGVSKSQFLTTFSDLNPIDLFPDEDLIIDQDKMVDVTLNEWFSVHEEGSKI